jgi:hypothetical protein
MSVRSRCGASGLGGLQERRVPGSLMALLFALSVGGAHAASTGPDVDAPQSSYAVSAGTDYQSGQDFSFGIDQALASRNQFLLSGGRTRVQLVSGYQDGYNGSLGMTTDPDRPFSYGASVNMAYLGRNLKSQSLTGTWSYASDTWMFAVKPTLRTIAIYVPAPPPPKNTNVLGSGGSIAATRFFGDRWSVTAGGEYNKYWGDTGAVPVLLKAIRTRIPLAFITNFLRERWWLETEYDFDSVSVLAGLDDSHTLLSRDWISTTYLHADFNLSSAIALNSEFGATGFSTANWYVSLGLTWYR